MSHLRMGRRLVVAVISVAAICVLIAATAWGVLAIYYSGPASAVLRIVLSVLFGVFGLATLILLWRRAWRWRALGAFALALASLLVWWGSIAPSNDRHWKPEGAVLPYATIEGDRVTMHNIRDFDYRSETDFTPRYYDKTFVLHKLRSVDLVASYWAGPAIAHIFLSFGFGPNNYLAISIERRDERGEGYSAIKGLFKQYELMYVVADERDVIRLRTNFRNDPPEQVYLYRLRGSPESARSVFRDYLREINSLRQYPQFYNTLTTNCTGNIWLHARVNPGHVPYSWKILASGYVPEYLYEQGRLDTRLSFSELQRRGHINALARTADDAPDFSERIRAELPIPAMGLPP